MSTQDYVNNNATPGKGLTSIHGRIHCAATPDTTETDNELDDIAIDHFLDALAEVALAIARRKC